MMKSNIVFIFMCCLIVLSGCAGTSNIPTVPSDFELRENQVTTQEGSKHLWGLWDVIIDTSDMQVKLVPLRGPEFTCNVVMFLQPPAGSLAYLGVLVTDMSEYMTEGRITVEVTLMHPFPGYDEFTGFDIYGIFVHEGGKVFPHGIDLISVTDGVDGAILENADGYTCWMSPVLFPEDGTILTFKPGALGDPGFPGIDGADANGYKYFADGLAVNESVAGFFGDENNFKDRGKFSSGSVNSREYQLVFPMVSGSPVLEFQYAVTANWEPAILDLSGDPDILDVPDDFPVSANARESFFVNVIDKSTTWYVDETNNGGDIILDLGIFDWNGLDGIGTIYVSSADDLVPGGYQEFDPSTLTWSEGTFVSSVTTVEITSAVPSGLENQEVLITVESSDPTSYHQGFGTPAPDFPLANYFRHTVTVSDTPPGGDVEAMGTAIIEPYFDGFGPEGNVDDPIPTEWWLTLDASDSTGTIAEYLWEMNGDDLFDEATGMIVSAGFPDPGTHVIKLKVTNGSGGESIYELPGSYEVVEGTYVWWASPIDFNNGSREAPWYFIPDGLTDAGLDGYILVRGDDGDGGQCDYIADLLITSVNDGVRVQGFYGDYDADQPPLQTGYVKLTGSNITFDGFEVTGNSQADYQPYGWDSKLGVQQGQDNMFRHIYEHDIGPSPMGDGLVAWDGGTMTVQNCLINELNMSFMIYNRTHHNGAHTDLINCTFDRLVATSTAWGWYNSGTGTSDINNCIWTDIGSGSSTHYLCRDGAGTYQITYNNCCDTPTLPDGGDYYAMNYDPYYFDPDPGTGCITEDPLYVDPFSDHHLQSGSPCEDTGDPGIQDADGSISDMGCYGGPYGDWDFEN